jgi:hypothetical protein
MTLRWEFFVQFLWSLPWCVLINASPYCLNKIIQYIECKDCGAPTSANYMWVFGLLFASIFESLTMQAALHKGRRIYVHTVSICNAQVFAKALRRKDMASPVDKTDEDGKETKDDDKKKKDGSANISSKCLAWLLMFYSDSHHREIEREFPLSLVWESISHKQQLAILTATPRP